jgi:hypothetical protein
VVTVLALGGLDDATAQGDSHAMPPLDYAPQLADGPVRSPMKTIVRLFIGSFGALITASAGIAAALCAVLRKWKTAGVMLLIAAAVFTVRSLLAMWLNYPAD